MEGFKGNVPSQKAGVLHPGDLTTVAMVNTSNTVCPTGWDPDRVPCHRQALGELTSWP